MSELDLSPYLPELLAAFGAIVTGIITVLGRLLAKKLNLELTAEREARLEHYARQAAKFAEEQAAAAWRARHQGWQPPVPVPAPPAVPSGPDKLSTAAAYLQTKAPGLSLDDAKAIVTAALPDVGLGARASLGNAPAGAPARPTLPPLSQPV